MKQPIKSLKYITEQIRNAKSTRFIIGAGASRSAGVLTASEMVAEISEKYAELVGGLPEDNRQDYGKVMRLLNPSQREEYIKPLLNNAKINWGQIALASLIANNHISSVLTFNFDLILERASALLGLQVPVYDFGAAPTDNVRRLANPAIIHLHGQSFGMVLLNTDEETKQHKKAIEPILKETVQEHLTVVIGYSGMNDSAFEVIADKFNSECGLLWLGRTEKTPDHLKPLIAQDYADYIGGLDFDYAMIELAKGLQAWPTPLFENPMKHLISELKPVTKYPVMEGADHYDILSAMRMRLEQMGHDWEEDADCTNEALSYFFGKNIIQKSIKDLASKTADLSDIVLIGMQN